MPVYPGTPPVQMKAIGKINDDGFREQTMQIATHTGTHIDAPAHILENGFFTNQFDLSAFTGTGIAIKAENGHSELIRQLQSCKEELQRTDFVLLNTGHDVYWGQDSYFSNIPAPSNDVIKYLCQFNLKGIGIDAISIDPVGSTRLENHHTILEKNMIIIENLTNLSHLIGLNFRFNCFPLSIEHGDGSPVRAMAEIQE